MCVHYSTSLVEYVNLILLCILASTPRSNIILLYVLVVRALCILCIVS